MPKKRQSRKVYGAKTHYWNNEIKLLLIAALCVYRALEFSTKAKEVYKSILEAWGKPNVYFLYEQLISELSDTDLKEFEKEKRDRLSRQQSKGNRLYLYINLSLTCPAMADIVSPALALTTILACASNGVGVRFIITRFEPESTA